MPELTCNPQETLGSNKLVLWTNSSQWPLDLRLIECNADSTHLQLLCYLSERDVLLKTLTAELYTYLISDIKMISVYTVEG